MELLHYCPAVLLKIAGFLLIQGIVFYFSRGLAWMKDTWEVGMKVNVKQRWKFPASKMWGDRMQNKVEKKGTPQALYLLKQHTLSTFHWVVPLIKNKIPLNRHWSMSSYKDMNCTLAHGYICIWTCMYLLYLYIFNCFSNNRQSAILSWMIMKMDIF